MQKSKGTNPDDSSKFVCTNRRSICVLDCLKSPYVIWKFTARWNYKGEIACLLLQKNGLNIVVERLESNYFAEYGYLFPLTGRKGFIFALLSDYI